MKKATRLIRGGLLVSFLLGGLFLLGILQVQAEMPIENIRETVEEYILEKYGTTTRPFFINPPMVLEIKNGELTPEQKPLIIGLAPNNTILRIYIDEIFVDTIPVFEKDAQVAIFAYQPKWLLARELHSIYVTAVNKQGVISKSSNRLYFDIGDAFMPQISATRIEADEEEVFNEKTSNLVLDFNDHKEPKQGQMSSNGSLLESNGITKEFTLFLVLIIVLFGWVWYRSRE